MVRRKLLAALMLGLNLSAFTGASNAQAWPTKPVRIVVPAPPGTPIDVMARMLGSQMQTQLGQTVIVDNRPGADGSIAASAVGTAPNDGHTLLLGNAGIFTINPAYSTKLSYDPVKQFAPVARLATAVLVLGVHPSIKVGSVADLVAQAKREPGNLTYASSTGRSGLAYLSGELLKARTGADIRWVGYSQDSQALNDLLAGRISLYIDALGTSLPHHKSGGLKIIAVTGEKRAPQIPDIPTIVEGGLPGVSGEAWVGLFAPAGTPADVVARLNATVIKSLDNNELKDRLTSYGFNPAGSTPQELAGIVHKDLDRWSSLIKELKLSRE